MSSTPAAGGLPATPAAGCGGGAGHAAGAAPDWRQVLPRGGETLVTPSILNADFARLAEVAAAVDGHADWLHVDVMDNHFVPNLTIGLPVVAALHAATPLPLDCHLMIDDPDTWAPQYAEAGAASVTLHAEAATDIVRTARRIRAAGARAGLAVKPATPIEPYADLLDEIDMLLVMTIEPGFGGQQLIPATLDKVRAARALLGRTGVRVWLQVDGGVNADTIDACARAGADVFVAGTAVFGAGDPAGAVDRLRQRAAAALPR